MRIVEFKETITVYTITTGTKENPIELVLDEPVTVEPGVYRVDEIRFEDGGRQYSLIPMNGQEA